MKTVIIDYGSGNLTSVARALIKTADADMTIKVSDQASDINNADYLVLPGVGAFGDCYASLTALEGVKDSLIDHIQHKQRPFLGICVGMQLLAEWGLEHGKFQGLGIIPSQVIPITPQQHLKIPNIGWHPLCFTQDHILHDGLSLMNQDNVSEDWFYFVHSYHMICDDPSWVASKIHYGQDMIASIAKDNIYATQFHPEKSQEKGLCLLNNFLHWKP